MALGAFPGSRWPAAVKSPRPAGDWGRYKPRSRRRGLPGPTNGPPSPFPHGQPATGCRLASRQQAGQEPSSVEGGRNGCTCSSPRKSAIAVLRSAAPHDSCGLLFAAIVAACCIQRQPMIAAGRRHAGQRARPAVSACRIPSMSRRREGGQVGGPFRRKTGPEPYGAPAASPALRTAVLASSFAPARHISTPLPNLRDRPGWPSHLADASPAGVASVRPRLPPAGRRL